MTYTKQFAKETDHAGIRMTLIGQWQDLAAYYAGSDGNAWMWHDCTHHWVNQGELAEFKSVFPKRYRGELNAA